VKWRSRTHYEPLSMIPANGWQAVYAWGDEGDAEKGDVCAHASPLVAFVLAKVTVARIYEDGTEEVTDYFPAIVGYDAGSPGIVPAEKAPNFVAYLPPGEPIDSFLKEAAREWVEKNAKKVRDAIMRARANA